MLQYQLMPREAALYSLKLQIWWDVVLLYFLHVNWYNTLSAYFAYILQE